jgi:hypothetical protein
VHGHVHRIYPDHRRHEVLHVGAIMRQGRPHQEVLPRYREIPKQTTLRKLASVVAAPGGATVSVQ